MSKDTILFIAGAGMDHRIVKNIEIDKEIFNPIISIDLQVMAVHHQRDF